MVFVNLFRTPLEKDYFRKLSDWDFQQCGPKVQNYLFARPVSLGNENVRAKQISVHSQLFKPFASEQHCFRVRVDDTYSASSRLYTLSPVKRNTKHQYISRRKIPYCCPCRILLAK